MSWLKQLAKAVCGDYSLYRIYALDLQQPLLALASPATLKTITQSELAASSNCDEIKKLGGYQQPEAYCFGAYMDGRLACACWVWYGDTYRTQRNFWPLKEREAKLVQIVTDPGFRGVGLAPALISFTAQSLKALGFKRIYARIWHSNAPSLSAFRKVGWREIAFAAELFPFGMKRAWRFIKKA